MLLIILIILFILFSYYLFLCVSKENFDNKVKVIYYYRPNCPHCVTFMEIWKDFESRNVANTEKINCVENMNKCSNIKYVPYISYEYNGKELGYEGKRNVDDMIKFIDKVKK